MSQKISDEELLDEIRRLADETPPTHPEMDKVGNFGSAIYIRRFGSWNEAIREAGFLPNKRVSAEDFLTDLREVTDGSIAPTLREYNNIGRYNNTTAQNAIGTWWQTVVQAGLQPPDRRPLSPSQFNKFHKATLNQQDPQHQLVGLLAQFTGLTRPLIEDFSKSWIEYNNNHLIITVPSEKTSANERWVFRLPETWTYSGKEKQTELPALVDWYFNERNHNTIGIAASTCMRIIYTIADDAGLSDSREMVNRYEVGKVPNVTRKDLRATGGIQMARNGAPARRIRRHIGIEHTNWEAKVEDFFLWLYVREGYEHPDYNPPKVVLNPV